MQIGPFTDDKCTKSKGLVSIEDDNSFEVLNFQWWGQCGMQKLLNKDSDPFIERRYYKCGTTNDVKIYLEGSGDGRLDNTNSEEDCPTGMNPSLNLVLTIGSDKCNEIWLNKLSNIEESTGENAPFVYDKDNVRIMSPYYIICCPGQNCHWDAFKGPFNNDTLLGQTGVTDDTLQEEEEQVGFLEQG